MSAPFLPVADIMASKAFQQVVTAENARLAHFKRQCVEARGKSAYIDPYRAKTVEQMVEMATEAQRKADAFAESLRGQFLQAVLELETLGFHEAATVRAIYCRHLADEREATDHDAIHRATRILADIKHSVAIEAIRVLTHIGAPMTRAA